MENIIICDAKTAAQISSKIDEIVNILYKSQEAGVGLMGGKSGEALFWAYYFRYSNNEAYEDKYSALILESFEQIKNGFNYFTYANGIAGVGWTLEHLAKNDFINVDTNMVLEDIDKYLYSQMLTEIRKGNYDYLHGALGIGLYFLSRLSNPETRVYLADLVDELEKQGTRFKGSIAWKSRISLENDIIGFNLSMSHGISSIIVFLSRLYKEGINKEKVTKLTVEAVNYLLQNKHKSGLYKYPGYIGDTKPEGYGRLAWCYNDLGISMALWQAGKIFHNEKWQQEALDTILQTTSITDLSEAGVLDAGLCHGTAGIAHIYNRMYKYTMNETFKNSAEYWFKQTLKLAVYEDGLAGYKAYRTPKYGGIQCEYGLLEGIAGIGLAMISAVSDIDPKWDSLLLLS